MKLAYAGCALTGLSLYGCAASSGATARPGVEPGSRECTVQLGPRPAASPRPLSRAPIRAAAPSQIVVHAEAPLAPLQQTLESRIERRLAAGSVGIGPGGTVSYSAERGALALSVTRTALLIETPVRARAEACRGERCYASCEPEALVRAEVPLMLRADYRFAPATVSLRFTRGCKVRALGGFLSIDVTPTLEAQLKPELAKVAREIDRQLPDVRAEAEKAWRELSLPRALPLVGCLVLSPSGIVQGPVSASAQLLHARFALLATPELRSDCGEALEPQPLPPLRSDPLLPEEGLVRLGLVTPLAGIERAFVAAQPLQLSGKQLRVASADVSALGSDVDLELQLAGEVCGSVALRARPEFSGAGQYIGLTAARLEDVERERLASSDLEPSALAAALVSAPRVAPLLSVHALRDTAPTLATALSQPAVDVSAKVSAARAAGAIARGDELVAWIEARGGVWLKPKLLQ